MARSSVHDPKILDTLSSLNATSIQAKVYRAVFAGRDPTIGSLAGGRWSPPQTFEALYTSLHPGCAIAEVLFHLERQPIFPTRAVELHTLDVKTENTIDLTTQEACLELGLDERALTSLDYSVCQEIGHAAEFLGFDALRVKSARSESDNMVIIVGHLIAPIVPLSKEKVDWPKYR